MAAPPITSKQWLARVGLVVGLAASEVVLAAVCGASAWQVLVLAGGAAIFAISYLLTASPGKVEYDGAAFRPVFAMRVGSLAAAAATGGLLSPLLPLVAVPIAIAWTMVRPRWRDLALALGVLAVLLATLHPALSSPRFSGAEVAVLAGWSTIVAAWAIFRRVAELLRVQRAQAASLVRMRDSALADAESRRQGIGSMTTKLAHELKNPLAAIKSLVQLEARRATDDRSQRRLDVVLAEVERIEQILREYLDLARPVVDARAAPVNLGELMSDVAALVAGRAEVAGIELVVEGAGGSFQADAHLLKEALLNVVCNAIEATARGGLVAMTYELTAAGLNIAVRDTGTGMTRDVAARIGTPYFTTREGGAGLGVVLAKTAIGQHGGTLEYETTPGIGTVAKIALPVDFCCQQRVAA